MRRCDAGELVTNEGEHKLLPNAIRDALAEAEDPLAAGEVERVFPHGAADALVEEEVVRRGQEGRGRMEVRPEGPEGLDRGKGGYFLDTLFVVCDLIPWRALLAEPEDPSACGAISTTVRASLGRSSDEGGDVRTCYGEDGRTAWGAPTMTSRGSFLSRRSLSAHPRGWSKSVLKARVRAVVLRRRMRQPWLLLQSWMMFGSPCPCLRGSEIAWRLQRGWRNNWP